MYPVYPHTEPHVSSQLVTAASEEPVTLDEARAQLGEPPVEDNDKIQRLISTAREILEREYRRACLNQTWDFAVDSLPCGYEPIYLPRSPVVSVSSITSYDLTNTPVVMSNTNYFVDTLSEPGRIALNSGFTWWTASNGVRARNTLVVRFVAGYGTSPDAVPQAIRSAILLLVEGLYNGLCAEGQGPEAWPLGVADLMSSFDMGWL